MKGELAYIYLIMELGPSQMELINMEKWIKTGMGICLLTNNRAYYEGCHGYTT